MNNSPAWLTCIICLMFCAPCGPDDDNCFDETNPRCPNYDECLGYPAANSGFKFFKGIRFNWADTLIDIEVDTAYAGSTIYFKADSNNLASYTWRVGNDPNLFNSPEFDLNFTNFSGDVDVTLTTTADTNLLCLIDNQLQDVKVKRLHIASQTRVAPVFGTFRGSIINNPNQREHEIQVSTLLNSPYQRVYNLPLPGDCDFNDRGIPIVMDYQFLVSSFIGEGPTPRCRNLIVVGRMTLGDSDEITIDYVYDDDDGSRKEVTFVGRRVD